MLDRSIVSSAWKQTTFRFASGTMVLDHVLPVLVEAYGKGERHYHTLQHVLQCLINLNTFPEPIPFRAEIELALWFHDAIYDPQRTDKEAQSAALLRSLCADSGLSARFIDRAARLVRVTDHKTEPDQGGEADMAEAEAIIAEVDMSILAAPPDQYLIYTQQIRQEYACYEKQIEETNSRVSS